MDEWEDDGVMRCRISEMKGRKLGGSHLIKQAVEVDMHHSSCSGIQQNILTVPISQTHNVSDDGHNSQRACVHQTASVPTAGCAVGVGVSTGYKNNSIHSGPYTRQHHLCLSPVRGMSKC